MNAPRIERIDPAGLTEADARAIGELGFWAWPGDDNTPEQAVQRLLERRAAGEWRPGDETWFAVRDEAGGKIVARARTFRRRIVPEQAEPMTVLALAGVTTHPEFRTKGLGSAMVARALEEVTPPEVPFALFQTTPPRQRFYERLGCVLAENRFVNSLADDPEARPWWNELVFRYPAGGDWPEGVIDLGGPGY